MAVRDPENKIEELLIKDGKYPKLLKNGWIMRNVYEESPYLVYEYSNSMSELCGIERIIIRNRLDGDGEIIIKGVNGTTTNYLPFKMPPI